MIFVVSKANLKNGDLDLSNHVFKFV